MTLLVLVFVATDVAGKVSASRQNITFLSPQTQGNVLIFHQHIGFLLLQTWPEMS